MCCIPARDGGCGGSQHTGEGQFRLHKSLRQETAAQERRGRLACMHTPPREQYGVAASSLRGLLWHVMYSLVASSSLREGLHVCNTCL
jgi:hypothetical protein